MPMSHMNRLGQAWGCASYVMLVVHVQSAPKVCRIQGGGGSMQRGGVVVAAGLAQRWLVVALAMDTPQAGWESKSALPAVGLVRTVEYLYTR